MNERLLGYTAIVASVLSALSVFLIDKPVALFVNSVGGRSCAVLQYGTKFLEVISGLSIARYALSYFLFGMAAVLFFTSARRIAWAFLFVSCAQLAGRLLVSELKDVFGRLRPFQVANANWNPYAFFVHGASWPSGHTVHFWGLFFPLAYLFPRYRVPLVVVPAFIAIARIGVNDHWCSDVLGSIAISAAVTLVFVKIFRMQPQPAQRVPAPSERPAPPK
jgi:membrane-associated phospholipid phosphatase